MDDSRLSPRTCAMKPARNRWLSVLCIRQIVFKSYKAAVEKQVYVEIWQ